MPGEPDDDYRMVLGEEILDWRELTQTSLRQALSAVADLLEPLADGRKVALMTTAYEVECLPSIALADALYSPDGGLPVDERRRLQPLLDKCRTVQPLDADIPRPVRREGGQWTEPSWGMAHALARAAEGRAMSCVIGSAVWPKETTEHPGWPAGWLMVELSGEGHPRPVALHLLRAADDEPVFWREVLTGEACEEETFFLLSGDAFPQLLFAESLRFQHFDGAYAEVLPWLVKLLGLLSDHFAATLLSCSGDQKKVQARFKALGVDISPESPNTKKNAKAWQQRLVVHDDEQYRCEWHGKRLWDRDRVHFSLPIKNRDGRVLIGIFTDHLDT